MASAATPKVLILGHSFVKRLKGDLEAGFDSRVDRNFNLRGSAFVHMFGVGGRTVSKLRNHDLHVLTRLAPDVVILEIGTNDLSQLGPEVVASEIEDFVSMLRKKFSVRVIGVCQVIPRGESYAGFQSFNSKVPVLNQCVCALLEHIDNVFCWYHKGFSNPLSGPILHDGVHLDPRGQYYLYRSYRGIPLSQVSFCLQPHQHYCHQALCFPLSAFQSIPKFPLN